MQEGENQIESEKLKNISNLVKRFIGDKNYSLKMPL